MKFEQFSKSLNQSSNRKYILYGDFYFKACLLNLTSGSFYFYYTTHGKYCQIFDISAINFVHYIFSQKNETLKGLFLFSKFREQFQWLTELGHYI